MAQRQGTSAHGVADVTSASPVPQRRSEWASLAFNNSSPDAQGGPTRAPLPATAHYARDDRDQRAACERGHPFNARAGERPHINRRPLSGQLIAKLPSRRKRVGCQTRLGFALPVGTRRESDRRPEISERALARAYGALRVNVVLAHAVIADAQRACSEISQPLRG